MPSTVDVLNHVLFRETSALLPYLKFVGPWAGTSEVAAQANVQQLVAEHDGACQQIADLVVKRHGIAATARFPHEFSSVHFIALDHLLPWLAAFQRWLIEKLEADVQQVHGDEEASGVLKSFLDLKRRQLSTIDKLTEEYSGAKAVSTRR